MRIVYLFILPSSNATWSPPPVYMELDDLFAMANLQFENMTELLPFANRVYPRDVVFETHDGSWGYHSVSGVIENVPNQRSFIIETDSNDVVLSTSYANYENDILLNPVDRSLEPLRITRSSGHIPEGWRHYENYLGLGYGSDFAQSVGSLLIVPRFDTKLNLVAGPSNPQSFCLDNELVTIPAYLTHLNSLRIHIEVSLLNPRDLSFIALAGDDNPLFSAQDDFKIQMTSKLTILPLPVRQKLRQIIRERFGPITREFIFANSMSDTVAGDCVRMKSELPSFSLTIRNDRFEPVHQILFSASDYISEHEISGRCVFHLSLDGTNHNSPSVLGLQFLERVGVYFDYTNRQVGFCDPL